MPNAEPLSLGGWVASELAETARLEAGIGTDQDVPAISRFVASVAKVLRRRRATDPANEDPRLPAVFLLCPVPALPDSQRPPKRIPMLNNGREPLNGRVWFLNAPAASGYYVPFNVADDDELFRLVTDAFGLGAIPAIIFDPRVHVAEIRFYPAGLEKLDECDVIWTADEDVTLDRIYPVIERVYKSCLVTPDAQVRAGKLWADPQRGWASRQAEAIVQLQLLSGLVTAFPTCTVRPEQPMPEGRDDLEIERSDPLDRSQVTRLALIELKVLRGFRESGSAVAIEAELRRVEDGVKQASAYCESKGFRRSTLCCFDMRLQDTSDRCFDHVRRLASDLRVDLKRWFIYASSLHYREALAASRSPALGS